MSELELKNIVGFKAVDAEGNEQQVTVDEMAELVSARIVSAASEISTFAATAAAGTDEFEDQLPVSDTFSWLRTMDGSNNPTLTSSTAAAKVLGGLIGVDNTIIKNKNSRVTDFNKAMEAGVYQVNLTNNIPPEANGPTSVYGNGILIVFTSIEFIGQIYIPLMYLNIDNIYIRERNSSDWFKWRKFNGTEL